MTVDPENAACTCDPLNPKGFNPKAIIPYGLSIEHIKAAMQDFLDFLSFVNIQLCTKQIPRLESFIMPANFSSIVGEFVVASIPKYCPTIVKNNYHNGHPDMLPKGMYKNNVSVHRVG